MDRYRRILRHRDFALLWRGATISALGDGMSFVALVWLLIERGGDPAAVGWLAAAYAAPVVIGGLVAGVALDRLDLRATLVADNLVRGLAVASIPVASALGVLSTAQLFVVAAVYGFLFMTSLAGIPTAIPSLVDDDELTTANAMESLSYGIAGLVGPALAGVVIAVVGAPLVLALDAATYLVFVLHLLAMRPIRPHAPAAGAGATRPASGGLGPAFRFVIGTPAILAITLMYMAVNVGEGVFVVLAPVYAREVLGGGAATYGLLISVFTGGSLLGAALVGAVSWRWPLGRSIAVATSLTGLTLATLVLEPPLAATMVVLALAGILASSLTAWAQTIRMRLIPPDLRGRVFALLRTLMQSTPPIGSVVGGSLLALGEVTPAIVTMAAFMLVPGLLGLVLPALGPDATAEPPAVKASAPTA
jgi:MFS family permease